MHNTSYILKFVLIMTAVVAFTLASLFTLLKDKHKQNEAIYNQKAIISAIKDKLPTPVSEMTNEEIQFIFDNEIKQQVFNMKGEEVTPEEVKALGYVGGRAEDIDMAKEKKKPEAERVIPFYTYKKGDKNLYIVTVRGNGLWDEIWGNIALEDDFTTIAGVDFDHKGETPGLGAEIKDNTSWKNQFTGKKIYDSAGKFTSVSVVKGGVKGESEIAVDGISGATITADGVDEMLKRGLKYYQPIFNKLKKS